MTINLSKKQWETHIENYANLEMSQINESPVRPVIAMLYNYGYQNSC